MAEPAAASARASASPSATTSTAAVRNPYPGLRPFRADEKHLFFGREHQVDKMIDKLGAHRFLAVVGGSGSGKSSLVNCGLRPALHRGYLASAGARWRMAQMRPGSDPIGALARALAEPGVLYDTPMTGALSAAELVESTLRLGSLGLVDIVEQADLANGTQLLVVADQFEELFRFRTLVRGARPDGWGAAEDAVAFVRLLLEAAAQTTVPIHIVLTMRSDFLGDCAQFQGLPEAINEGQYLVPRLTRNEIRDAITGPAGVAGATINPVLVTRLLNDVGDNPDQLSILQHALNRSWAFWELDPKACGVLELVHYEAAGGMSRALDMHAEKAFGELAAAGQQRLCEQLFKALTDTGTDPRGIRRPTKALTLAEMTGATSAQLVAVIDVFRKPSRSFLMPPISEALGPDSVIDISHESLMRVWLRLKAWADDEAHSARIYRRLRETALEHEQGHASLWRDPDLRLMLDWRTKNTPTEPWAAMYGGAFDTAMQFLDLSRDAQNQEKAAAEIERRWLAYWSYVPLALVLVPFIFAQDRLADWLKSADWVVDVLKFLHLSNWAGTLSHLLSGLPAALLYMALAPYIKKRFPIWERWFGARAMVQSAVTAATAASAATTGIGLAASVATAPVEPALDTAALGYAGFLRRATAQLVDWVVCLALAFVIAVIWNIALVNPLPEDATPAAVVSTTGPAEAASASDAAASAAAATPEALAHQAEVDAALGAAVWTSILVFWLYHAHFWTSKHRATWGMRVAGIVITDLTGHRIGRLRATARFFARFVSYYTVGVGFLMQRFSAKRQTLHDRICGTVVVRRPPPKAPVVTSTADSAPTAHR